MARGSAGAEGRMPKTETFASPEVQDAAGSVLANIQFASAKKEVKTVAVVSPSEGEGKTAAAVALACAMGDAGLKCLLVEGDMRNNSLRQALHLTATEGIAAVVSGRLPLAQAVESTRFANVDFLGAEGNISSSTRVLNAPGFGAFLEAARNEYAYVVFSTPPLLECADGSVIASKADATVLVVREMYTLRDEAREAADQLMAAQARVLGLVYAS